MHPALIAGLAASLTARGHPAAATPKPVTLTVAASGDFLIHAPIWQQARRDGHGRRYDFRPMVRLVAPIVRNADLALCHVETPMTKAPPHGYPVFNTPPALATAIRWAGYDVCDTASNHSLDRGQHGIDATGTWLRRAGLAHTGSFPSRSSQRRITMLTARGVKVAFLAYTEMTNGIRAPHPWSVNYASAPRILADARRARRAGARVVIVNLHWGTENVTRPSAFQRRLADRLTRSRAITAIVGQHVHVVQPIRRVHGKLVVFGEGNLISSQTPACCAAGSEDGLIALVRIVVTPRTDRVASIRYVPTWVRHPDYTVVPIGYGLRHHSARAAVLRASYRRTVRAAGHVAGVRAWLGPLR